MDHVPSFLNYTPVPLAFGTSGLRGLVKDITDLEAYINVKATLRYLLNLGDIRSGSTVVLAGDLRPSTDRIMGACVQAIVDLGLQVENAGKIPTPALASFAIANGQASVMVTGSHIPFDRNGIKITKSVGELLKSDEAGINREVTRLRGEEYGRSAETSLFDASGMLKTPSKMPTLNRAGEKAYINRYLHSFARPGLAGLRVLVYQHSAVGRDLLVRILRELGAEVVTAGRSEKFIPIDTENITDTELERLEGFAIESESGAKPVQAIVSTDGDSDRPLMLAVAPAAETKPGQRRVRFLPGDLLGIVVAEYLKASGAVVPISANDAVERRLGERKILLEKTKIGSPFVIAALDQLNAVGNLQRIVGWEANGGFLTGSDILLPGGMLTALPTRDAILPILANLFAAAEQGISLSALWDRLPARFGCAGLLDNFPAATSQAIFARIIPPNDVTEVEFTAETVFDRSLASAIPLPSTMATAWKNCKASLETYFASSFGFDAIARINILDGVRVYFCNGDIAHIRPSGNAPQLRIYANSDSQTRANDIVNLALQEPDGILRRLEHAFAK